MIDDEGQTPEHPGEAPLHTGACAELVADQAPSTELESNAIALQPGTTISEMEKALILMTLEHCKQNRTRAAKMLGISIRTLRNKLKKYTGDRGLGAAT